MKICVAPLLDTEMEYGDNTRRWNFVKLCVPVITRQKRKIIVASTIRNQSFCEYVKKLQLFMDHGRVCCDVNAVTVQGAGLHCPTW